MRWALTLVAAAVLAACGGSGGSGPFDAGDGRPSELDVASPDVLPEAGDGAATDIFGDLPLPADASDEVAADAADVPDEGPADLAPDLPDTDPPDGADVADGIEPSDADDVPDIAADVPTVPCFSLEDCERAFPFAERCEVLHCIEGSCASTWIEDCCLDDAECFDWDECTDDRCDGGSRQCDNAPSEDPLCCAGSWLGDTGFEEGLPGGWTATGPDDARARWHVTTRQAASGAGGLSFADPASGTYDTGYREQGTLTGPWLDIPVDEDRPVFRFSLRLDTEWRHFEEPNWSTPWPLVYDLLTLSLELDDGGGETEIWSSYSIDVAGTTCDPTLCRWEEIGIGLDAFRGRRVRPIFRFDTGDHVDNDYAGPAIDDLGLLLACGTPPECLTSGDCDDQDPCTDDRCVARSCEHDPNYLPGCCYDYERASWHFDPLSLSGFTVVPSDELVRWHISESRAVTGTTSLRFGSLTNNTYDDPGRPVSGYAESPWVYMPYWNLVTLNLSVWVDVEPHDPVTPERDLFQITALVAGDGIAEETVVWDRSSLDANLRRTWVPIEVDLGAFATEMILLRFRFSSADSENNTGEGVYIDDIRVIRRCP